MVNFVFLRHVSTAIVTALLIANVSVLHAQPRDFIVPNGDFDVATNWNPAFVPGATNAAQFFLSDTYDVNFNRDEVSTHLRVENGDVTFVPTGSPSDATRNYLPTRDSQIDDDGTLRLTSNGDRTMNVDISALLFVGRFNTGALHINGGSQLATRTSGGIGARIGEQPGSQGIVTVSGADSSWDNIGLMRIGNSGTGTLEILDGGSVNVTNGNNFNGVVEIGQGATATGTLRVDGTNSELTTTSALRVGSNGQGSVFLSGGAELTSGELFVGNGASQGSGEFFVSGGSTLSSAGAQIGSNSSANTSGTVEVDGAGTSWNSSNFVGVRRNGTLRISGGANVTATATSVNDGGMLLLEGAGSQLTTSVGLFLFTVDGTLTVRDGAQLNTQQRVILGGQQGRLNLDGGTITTRTIGESESGAFNWTAGTLNITSTSPYTINSLTSSRVFQLTSRKELNVAGALDVAAGSRVSFDGGDFTTGSLFVTGGTLLGNESLDLSNGVNDNALVAEGLIANSIRGNAQSEIAASGMLAVGDPSSTAGFEFAGELHARNQQVVLLDADQADLGMLTTMMLGGRLNAINGAHLGSGEVLTVGDAAPSDLPGMRINSGLRMVEIGGGSAPANLAPSGTAFASIGATGTTNINDGDPSTGFFDNNGNTIAGIALPQSETISSIAWGSEITVAQITNTLNVGTYSIQFRNDGMIADDGGWTTIGEVSYELGDLFNRHRFDFDPVQATAIRLVVNNQMTNPLLLFSELELYADQGQPDVSALIDGVFTNNGTVNGPTGAGEFLVFNDQVNGAGNYTGNIQFSQGFSPGNSPAVISFEGDVAIDAAGALEIELGGSSLEQFDRLEIQGDVTLDGLLLVELLEDFVAAAGDSFEILDVGGTLEGKFIGLNEGSYFATNEGLPFRISYQGGDGNDVTLTAGLPGDFDLDGDVDGGDYRVWQLGQSPNPLSTSDLTAWRANYGMIVQPLSSLAAVPEPATAGMLITTLLGMLSVGRRRG